MSKFTNCIAFYWQAWYISTWQFGERIRIWLLFINVPWQEFKIDFIQVDEAQCHRVFLKKALTLLIYIICKLNCKMMIDRPFWLTLSAVNSVTNILITILQVVWNKPFWRPCYLGTIYWLENWHQWQLSELDKNSLGMSSTECTPCLGRAAEAAAAAAAW